MSGTTITTISEARIQLHDQRHTGSRCPCCGHYDRVYRRTITRSQVRFLRDLYRRAIELHQRFDAFVDVRHINDVRGGDYAKLVLWDLVESAPDENGIWRLTPLGLAFLRGDSEIPKHAYVYRGALERFGPETIDVHAAYDGFFNLDELMGHG